MQITIWKQPQINQHIWHTVFLWLPRIIVDNKRVVLVWLHHVVRRKTSNGYTYLLDSRGGE